MIITSRKQFVIRIFDLVNLIVDQMITHPRTVKEMYAKLPPSKLEAIERRDK